MNFVISYVSPFETQGFSPRQLFRVVCWPKVCMCSTRNGRKYPQVFLQKSAGCVGGMMLYDGSASWLLFLLLLLLLSSFERMLVEEEHLWTW